MRALRATFPVLLLCILLAGCATASPDGPMENDPLEAINRPVFDATIAVDKAVFRPTALVYRRVVPEPIRLTFRAFLANLNTPVILVNDVLQGEINRASITFIRASINTTVGIGGLVDVAARWGYPRHSEDFGQTLAVYGVGEGFYLFVPILGPGNPRDLIGFAVDFLFDPLFYVQWGDEIYVPYARYGVDLLDVRERNIETLDEIERNSLDYYASVRSLYRQTRANEIRNGATEVQDLPDF